MSVVIATIKSNGTEVPLEYELLYIDIVSEYNKIPYAELSYIDGNPAKQQFPISDSDLFEPGKEIEVKLRYEDKAQSEKTVFKGIVLKQGLQMSESGCTITIELSDKAVKMTTIRKSAVFEHKKDSDIIKALIADSGITPGAIAATTVQHKRAIQYQATNWDFMLSRADVNGLLVSVADGAVSAKAPSVAGAARHSFEFGLDEMYDFDLEADARHQYAGVESSAWDVKKQQLTAPKKAADFSLAQGNLKPGALAKVVGGDKDTLVAAVSLEEGESQAWADARMIRSRMSMLKGSFRVPGLADVLVGDIIELKGMGKRFSGKTLATGVRQQVTVDGWTTSIQFGLSPKWFSSNADIVDAKAAGLLPGVNGLQIGVVEKFEADPDKEHRVKVKVPAIDDKKGIVWARLATIDAGKERGMFFWPEPGDEVILGFLNDDPRQPVILGSVHSSANASPLKPADKNPQKGIVTKKGIKVLFDDEKQLLSISTSDNNIITINEKDKFIEIKDANKNIIKLNADGILLDSGKDVIIKSKGDIKITSSKNVEIKGSKIDVI